jgi:hypothetical protein
MLGIANLPARIEQQKMATQTMRIMFIAIFLTGNIKPEKCSQGRLIYKKLQIASKLI